ncbi:MAG TPA: HesA/MoeB/ThiF family protein [Candidatus Limnocylindrales bacterium]|nr:HesA/MoeB/ThiF family protein [Candidatus Limnocylindrales bacterium]
MTDTPNVLLIGAGALGCAAARALAATRTVALTLVDDDVVELSNLQRQVLYDGGDIGEPKVEAAAARLRTEFGTAVTARNERAGASNAAALLAGADIVIDACDDPDTKFLLNRECVQARLPLIYGGVARTGGQWMLIEPGRSCCLACVFPPQGSESAQGCSAMGILAPVAGLVGTMQALMALSWLARPSRSRSGRLFLYELTRARLRYVDFPRSPGCDCRAAASDPCARSDRGLS